MRIAPRSELNSVPSVSIPRRSRALCVLLVLACVAGCGIKGPLYLGKPPKATRSDVSKPPVAAGAAPVVPTPAASQPDPMPAASQPE
ncbi:hypothetical protein [Niveibacterium sp. SC-1]|uniref:LPS translocon maturation chaperone LptM n=1 Tax=Niveibacterium sp. SC-1 TaxID=3135646 RepID=UPI00311E967E